jgi:hypothetical protein
LTKYGTPKYTKNAKTIIGTPRITNTKTWAIILQTVFFTTLIRPNISPNIHAKNKPKSAKSNVLPIATRSNSP